MTARERRLENERAYLDTLISSNPGIVHLTSTERASGTDTWRLHLKTPAYSQTSKLVHEHSVRFVFPEYYPAVPIEAFLDIPVRHPNCHPETGFVCLWDQHSPGVGFIEAVLQLQRVIAGQLVNNEPVHVMQELASLVPLAFEPFTVPNDYYLQRSDSQMPLGDVRRRLSRAE